MFLRCYYAMPLRTGGSDPQISPFREGAGTLFNTVLLETTRVSLPTGAVLAQNFWEEEGERALAHQPLHRRVHFLRSSKPEKYKLYTGLRLKSISSRVANSVMG